MCVGVGAVGGDTRKLAPVKARRVNTGTNIGYHATFKAVVRVVRGRQPGLAWPARGQQPPCNSSMPLPTPASTAPRALLPARRRAVCGRGRAARDGRSAPGGVLRAIRRHAGHHGKQPREGVAGAGAERRRSMTMLSPRASGGRGATVLERSGVEVGRARAALDDGAGVLAGALPAAPAAPSLAKQTSAGARATSSNNLRPPAQPGAAHAGPADAW